MSRRHAALILVGVAVASLLSTPFLAIATAASAH